MENPDYLVYEKRILDIIPKLEQSMARANDENEKEQYQQLLDDANKNYEAARKYGRYQISAEGIAAYRAAEGHLAVNKPSSLPTFPGYGGEEVYELLGRYASGQIKIDQFLMELDQNLAVPEG